MHVPSLGRWITTFAVTLLFAGCGTAAPEDRYTQLLAKYETADTLQSTATLTLTKEPAEGEPMVTHLSSAFARPASLRIESTRGEGEMDTTVVTDGETVWQLIEDEGEGVVALKAPAPQRLADLASQDGPVVPGILGDLPIVSEYALFTGTAIPPGEVTITIADEPVEVAGVNCDQLTLTPEDGLTQRVAIARADGLLRQVAVDLESPDGTQTLHVVWEANEVTLGAEIPAERFVHQPPAEQKVFEAETIAAALENLSYGIGEPAPNFTLTSLDGQEVTLEQLRGKPVVIDFWATWCGPCETQQPGLKKLRDAYGDRINIVMISNETPEEVRPVVAERKLGMIQLTNPDNDVLADFGIEGFPTTFFLDAEGIVRAVHYGVNPNEDVFEVYKAEVEELLD